MRRKHSHEPVPAPTPAPPPMPAPPLPTPHVPWFVLVLFLCIWACADCHDEYEAGAQNVDYVAERTHTVRVSKAPTCRGQVVSVVDGVRTVSDEGLLFTVSRGQTYRIESGCGDASVYITRYETRCP